MNSSAEASGAERAEPASGSAAEPDSPEPRPSRHRDGTHQHESATDVSVAMFPGVRHRVDHHWLRARLSAAAAHIRLPVRRVSVIVVDDRRMTQLHDRFMGIPQTTDVLTFPSAPDESVPTNAQAIDVDIAVCADEAARQSALRGHPLDRELLLYALHGLLHCAGFDDGDDDAFRQMHAEEDRILTAIGEPATFASGPESSS